MIINMGPQHPSTHGVLRLLLELDGETVITCKPIIGYLHTGIEKNTEYRTWMQGITYVTRADYLSPFFNELGYCLAVERLLGIEAPTRAQVIRVLFCEMNRISSHLVWLATGGLELGAVSVMLYGFREREVLMDVFESVTGLRMNHAYIRIGGVIMDIHEEGMDKIREFLRRDARADRRVRVAALREPDLGRAQPRRRRAVGGRRARARRHRSDAARRRRARGPAQGHAVRRLRDVRLRRARAQRRRRVRALRGPAGRDAAVDAHHRAVPRAARGARAGDGRGPEGPVARAARGRSRRDRQLRGVRPPHHGGVDGGADPSLQDGDAGRRGPARRGLPSGGVAARRARVLRRVRRRAHGRTG